MGRPREVLEISDEVSEDMSDESSLYVSLVTELLEDMLKGLFVFPGLGMLFDLVDFTSMLDTSDDVTLLADDLDDRFFELLMDEITDAASEDFFLFIRRSKPINSFPADCI